ncbi:MAG: hypothetical protein K0041_09340 [Acidithiobacillus sp.]|nr:hypothetical protein [Acidithiobacillus sp.]
MAKTQVRWLLQSLPKLLIVELVVDDTMLLRHSTKAPRAAIRDIFSFGVHH